MTLVVAQDAYDYAGDLTDVDVGADRVQQHSGIHATILGRGGDEESTQHQCHGVRRGTRRRP